MNEREAVESICRTVWRNIESAVDSATRGVRDGTGQEVVNPFTGRPTRLSVPEPALRLRHVLQQRGVPIDAELVGSIRELVRDAAVSSNFALLADFDGEGIFEGNLNFRIHSLDGNQVPTYLHEVFREYNPATAAEPE